VTNGTLPVADGMFWRSGLPKIQQVPDAIDEVGAVYRDIVVSNPAAANGGLPLHQSE